MLIIAKTVMNYYKLLRFMVKPPGNLKSLRTIEDR